MEHHPRNKYDIRIIDALGPFIEISEHPSINWSKVMFSDLETSGHIPDDVQRRIIERFGHFTDRVARLGYNALSIDDVAHLLPLPIYNAPLQTLLKDYHSLYAQLFAIAKKKQLQIFVNTDYLFSNADIRNYLEKKSLAPDDFFADVLAQTFTAFPEIDGIILRIGENDGRDVTGSFLSHLQLRTPAQAHRLLQKILPIFERHNKTLIFRTWTVGVYRIGDLIWNEKTFHTVFDGITSDALIISMKYGDTDFMRYLSLNPLFFASPHKKILELQTRREWEGMGTYPSFVGWDYADYLAQLAHNDTVVGVHVWCQTGGWAKRAWSNVTYLDNSSLWNELNTEATIGIIAGQSVEEAVATFCEYRNIQDATAFLKLLKLSEIAIKKGLYLPELATKPLYFRRSRIPPLMWLTWDRVLLPSAVVRLHRMLVTKPEAALADSANAITAAKRMLVLAKELRLDSHAIASIEFEHATLVLFAELRRYILSHPTDEELVRINKKIAAYEKTYPEHYTIPTLPDGTPRRRMPRASLSLFLRESLAYRKRDRIMLKTSPIQARAIRYYLRRSKSHLADQSMGFEVFFK